MLKAVELIIILVLIIFSFFAGVKYSDSVREHASWIFETKDEDVELPDLSNQDVLGAGDHNPMAISTEGNTAIDPNGNPVMPAASNTPEGMAIPENAMPAQPGTINNPATPNNGAANINAANPATANNPATQNAAPPAANTQPKINNGNVPVALPTAATPKQ